uniref:Cell wall integrity and stress response component 4-like isoform X2 n=1 Tax=Crassostrea virginica TaxID=6565 RepID=A0A8B8CCD6_CRAVI|nr:cell wall integrity and stress response component 4-like isoform X2 [Crassostrea virginica]
MCEVAFSDGVAENLCEPTTMTPKETHVNIPQKTTITETSSFYSDITPDYASTDSSTSLLRFSTEKRHNLSTSDLSSVTISTDVRKTDYSPDASTQKQTTHKKLSPDLKTSVSSTTPSPITHGDTTFSSPISHGGDTFNSTHPSPSSATIPEATSNSTRDTTLSVDEDSDKGIGNALDYLFIIFLVPLLFIMCVCVLKLKRRPRTNLLSNSIEMECMDEDEATLYEVNTVKNK